MNFRRRDNVSSPIPFLSIRINKRPTTSSRHLTRPTLIATQPASALRALLEVIDREIRTCDADGELQIVAAAGDLHDVHPHEQQLHLHPLQVLEPVLGDDPADRGLVLQLVRPLEREAAGLVEVGGERAGGLVEVVAADPDGEDPSGEVVVAEDVVRRPLAGGARTRRFGADEEEGGGGAEDRRQRK